MIDEIIKENFLNVARQFIGCFPNNFEDIKNHSVLLSSDIKRYLDYQIRLNVANTSYYELTLSEQKRNITLYENNKRLVNYNIFTDENEKGYFVHTLFGITFNILAKTFSFDALQEKDRIFYKLDRKTYHQFCDLKIIVNYSNASNDAIINDNILIYCFNLIKCNSLFKYWGKFYETGTLCNN